MNCPACQRENPADAAFCSGCGQRLILTCPACMGDGLLVYYDWFTEGFDTPDLRLLEELGA
jgi:hypothetical protein